jgi:hypothetical protein
MTLQDFKDENFGKKLQRKFCGKTEEMETRCPSNDIITEKTSGTVDLCPKHSDANGTCHVRWKC